jgi:hypothetical protein
MIAPLVISTLAVTLARGPPQQIFHDAVKPMSCARIAGYISSYGLPLVLWGARQHGVSEEQIAAAIKKCKIKV